MYENLHIRRINYDYQESLVIRIYFVLFFLFQNIITAIVAYFPAGTSLKNLLHYQQNIESGKLKITYKFTTFDTKPIELLKEKRPLQDTKWDRRNCGR